MTAFCLLLLPSQLSSFQPPPSFVFTTKLHLQVATDADVGVLGEASHPLKVTDAEGESSRWNDNFVDFPSASFANTHAIFSSVGDYIEASTSGGVRGAQPFFASGVSDLTFSTADLKGAVAIDFLDAGQGTADRNKGWKMRPVGTIKVRTAGAKRQQKQKQKQHTAYSHSYPLLVASLLAGKVV